MQCFLPSRTRLTAETCGSFKRKWDRFLKRSSRASASLFQIGPNFFGTHKNNQKELESAIGLIRKEILCTLRWCAPPSMRTHVAHTPGTHVAHKRHKNFRFLCLLSDISVPSVYTYGMSTRVDLTLLSMEMIPNTQILQKFQK